MAIPKLVRIIKCLGSMASREYLVDLCAVVILSHNLFATQRVEKHNCQT